MSKEKTKLLKKLAEIEKFRKEHCFCPRCVPVVMNLLDNIDQEHKAKVEVLKEKVQHCHAYYGINLERIQELIEEVFKNDITTKI